MNPTTSCTDEKTRMLSHGQHVSSLDKEIKSLSKKIQERGDLPHVSVTEQLKILNAMASFPLGQFLIQNKGLNGYWTNYILMHPSRGRITGLNSDGQPFSEFEDFILNRAPTCLATQERFVIFQQELQKHCTNGTALASIPCGLMSDLLTLDFSDLNDYQLYGVDIDDNAISDVQERVLTSNQSQKASFVKGDAWRTPLPRKVDVITSNGLNIYEHDDTRVVELYRQFFDNLKPGGILITSFLTPPPGLTDNLEWNTSEINQMDARLQKIIFADILSVAWQAYRSSELTVQQLKDAGFSDIRIIQDRAGIFPTVIAQRQ